SAEFENCHTVGQLAILERLVEEAQASTYEAINSYYSEFLTIRLYGQDPLDKVATLNDKYELVRASADARSEYSERLDHIALVLRAIARLAKVHANLKDIDEQLLHGEVAVAASSIAEAGGLLQELESDCPHLIDHTAMHTLQTQYLKKRSALKAELDYLMSEMFRVASIGSVYEFVVSYNVTANYDDVPYENPVALTDLFFALTELGMARDKIDMLASTLIDHWFVPLLRTPSETLTVSKVKPVATLTIGAFMPGRKSETDQNNSPEMRCVLVKQKWEAVLGFIYDEMFHDINVAEDHSELYEYLGSRLWTVLSPLLREHLLIPLIPADIDHVSDAHAMVPLLELEEKWLEYGLISAESLFIKRSIRSSLQSYVNKRRRELLTTVASILATEDTNTVVVGGHGPEAEGLSGYSIAGGKGAGKSTKDSTKGKGAISGVAFGNGGDTEEAESLSFPRCSVSVHAQTLVEFARETVVLGLGDDAKTAALYLHAIRDAFGLYRCLMPYQWSTELLVNPKTAFVMHNDCQYICHHLSTLGFSHREQWPETLRSSVTFVDIIASYRALSKTCITPLLNRYKDAIEQALGPWARAGWLKDALHAGDLDYESAEMKLSVSCGIIGQVAQAGNGYLPQNVCLKILGLLTDSAVLHVCQRLEELDS
ncbi:ribosome biogenesis protein ytm1, partial [Dipsacomyces acuminosporus]